MNVAFFLTPKHEVVTLEKKMSIEEAMATMEEHRYTSVPVIDRHGKYVSTLSEGDILWHFKKLKDKTLDEIGNQSIRKIKRHYNIQAVSVDADIDSLIELAAVQAFVPVVDDAEIFIGIIKRSDIISYCTTKMVNNKVVLFA